MFSALAGYQAVATGDVDALGGGSGEARRLGGVQYRGHRDVGFPMVMACAVLLARTTSPER